MSILGQHEAPLNNNSGFSTIVSLINGTLIPGDIWREKSYRAKFCLRSLIAPRQTLRFFNVMTGSRYFSALLDAQKTLPSKIHRHYLHLGMNASSRVDAILNHYQFIDSLPVHTLANALTSPVQVPLFEIEGKNGEVLKISASTARGAEREGECTLWLHMGTIQLAALTFCVTGNHDGRQIVVGGLQGSHRSISHEVIKEATKACHGLFPKRILMETLWLLAEQQGVKNIYGVSDNGHVFRGLRYRLSKGKHFHASYNEFWSSINGVENGRHLFKLPLALPQKDLSEIASKKRSEYRKRYALLDSLKAKYSGLS